MTVPGIFSLSGSPITTTGTLAVTLATEAKNLVWAGPSSGSDATPTFRSLVGADLPNPSTIALGGTESKTCAASNWLNAISTSGVPACSQPAFTDISGLVAAAQLPNPTASTLGGIESLAAVSSKWINQISTSGVPSATQPLFSDIAGSLVLSQLPSIGNNTIIANNSGGTATPAALTATNILDMIAGTQGDVLYRNGSVWTALAPGTNGQVLTSGGAAANVSWQTIAGTGTVTSVATGTGLTGGAITTTGTISFANIADQRVLANTSGGSAAPIATTATLVLDIIGATEGDVLYRGASAWLALAPGTSGQVLQTQGAGATPQWANAGTISTLTIAAGTGIAVSGTCIITTSGTCTISSTARIILTTNTTFYIATTGNDSTGDGSSGNPWATWSHARAVVSTTYDTRGYTVTYSLAAGTYTDPLFCNGPLVGQNVGNNGSGELFRGAGAGSTIIKVNSGTFGNQYAIGVASGCQMTVEDMTLDQTNSANDTINIGNSGSILQIGADGITFGYNLYPWNDISVAVGGTLVVSGNVAISKPLFSTTASWSGGSNSLTVASCSGVLQYMGVLGANIPAGAYVSSCVSTTLTLAYGGYAPVTATTGSGSGTTIYFMSGGNAFLSLGNGAKAFWVGNGNPATSLQVIWANQAYYQQAIILADGNAGCNCQAMTFGYATAIYALPFLAINGGQIDTNFQGMQYFPGVVGQFNTLTATGLINTNTLTLSSTSGVFRGNSINAETCVAGTFGSGSTTITTTYTLVPGDNKYITGPSIAGGTHITNASGGTTFTIDTPTLNAEASPVTLCYNLAGIPPGTYITYISGTTVGLSQYLTAAVPASTPVYVGGIITSNGGYD